MSDAGEIIRSGAFDKLADIVHKLAGPFAEEYGLLLADKAKVYRVRNWVNVVKKTQGILNEAKLPPNAVPPRLFLPIIEASSLEEDETLQDLWAGLLASASEESDSLSPSFIETLKLLTPGHAVALGSIYDFSQSATESVDGSRDLSGWSSSNPDPDMCELAAENFERLGIIRKHYNLMSDYEFFVQSCGLTGQAAFEAFASQPLSVVDLPHLTYRLEFTEFGRRFMRACRGPKKNDDETETV
jgi:hypothetical protein